MKHGTPNHIKMKRLARLLGVSRAHSVGIVQLLWHATIEYALAGDIGRLSDDEIAEACDWKDDPARFVSTLVEAGWLDRCKTHRLVIHDWAEHAENWVKKRGRDRGVTLLMRGSEAPSPPTPPKLNERSTEVEQTFNKVEAGRTTTVPSQGGPAEPTCAKPSQALPSPACAKPPQEPPPDVRTRLESLGVGEPALSLLSMAGQAGRSGRQVTLVDIDREWADIERGQCVSPKRVLISRLCSQHGVQIPKGNRLRLSGDVASALAVVERRKEQDRLRRAAGGPE